MIFLKAFGVAVAIFIILIAVVGIRQRWTKQEIHGFATSLAVVVSINFVLWAASYCILTVGGE